MYPTYVGLRVASIHLSRKNSAVQIISTFCKHPTSIIKNQQISFHILHELSLQEIWVESQMETGTMNIWGRHANLDRAALRVSNSTRSSLEACLQLINDGNFIFSMPAHVDWKIIWSFSKFQGPPRSSPFLTTLREHLYSRRCERTDFGQTVSSIATWFFTHSSLSRW